MRPIGSSAADRDPATGITRRTLLAAAIAGAGAGALGRAARTGAAGPRSDWWPGARWPMAHHDLAGWRRGSGGPTALGERWRK